MPSSVQVKARDPDDGENAHIDFRLLSVSREHDTGAGPGDPRASASASAPALPLAIDPMSGDLFVNASLEHSATG